MITLTIKNSDGSVYWVEHFNDQPSCDKWLAEEMKRPYWDASRTAQWVDDTPPPPTQDQQIDAKLAQMRSKRNQLLSACDWTQLADAALDSVTKQAWRVYRQALRDLPASIPRINVLEQEFIFPAAPGAE